MQKLFLIFLFILPLFLLADKTYDPWYTGPLLACGGDNVEKGKFNVQPYLFYRDTYGIYNKAWGHHSIPDTFTFQTVLYLQAGITTWLDFTLGFMSFYKEREGKDSFEIGDCSATFGLQIIKQKDLTPRPSIRIEIEQDFPTGKYKNLNPNKKGIDASGSGSYETFFNFIISKVVYWITNHPISWRINLAYTHTTNVKVSNFNTYGGGYNTKGKVNPGHVYTGIMAFEFSFTQRWVYAMDFVYTDAIKKTFKGTPGITIAGEKAINSLPSSKQFSLAPALEYNFNKNLGILGGFHFSVKGENCTEYLTGFLSVTYTF